MVCLQIVNTLLITDLPTRNLESSCREKKPVKMMHIRNTHQDSETTVIEANRKHQIVLNMEVKRIEMEKKMRERYFCFEMSLMRARRVKIIERQKSLGIYRPHTKGNAKDSRKGMQEGSFFFTQSVAMDSKVKLPPVLDGSRTHPGFTTMLAGNSKMLNLSKKVNDNKMIIGKEQAKRLRQSRKLRTFEGNSAHSEHPQTRRYSKEDDGINDGNERQTDKAKDNLTSDISNNEDEIKNQLVDGQNLLHKDEKQAGTQEGIEKEVQESEHDISNSNSNSPFQGEAKNNHLLENSAEVAKQQNSLKKLSLNNQTEFSSTKAQNIRNFTNFQELQSWHNSMDTSQLFTDDINAPIRLKSATGYRNNVDVSTIVRPQTALAKLTIK